MATLKALVDETTNIKNELVTCHTNLKDNLSDKGVEVSETDKMSNLIDKVGSIATGKKWASGTYKLSSFSADSSFDIPISCDFSPSRVVLEFDKMLVQIYTYTKIVTGGVLSDVSPYGKRLFYESSAGQTYYEIRQVSSTNINVYCKVSAGNSVSNVNITWTAYE